MTGKLSRKVDRDILNLSRESKSFVVAGRRFHICAVITKINITYCSTSSH